MDKRTEAFKEDLLNEGKEAAYLDVDRMINEGLSGGSVHKRDDSANIEQSIQLPKEAPPRKNLDG
ncbi:hypothetical protein ACFSCX_21500 [Bacillus salitolerans]|uniref:Sporulation protein n=1 Tax=Bacillus salitolerans TaxID=1437434 RepID=A0ABW4LW92_9BACI